MSFWDSQMAQAIKLPNTASNTMASRGTISPPQNCHAGIQQQIMLNNTRALLIPT